MIREYGLTHLYLDQYIENFSNVSTGIILRASGFNLKIKYYNSDNSTKTMYKYLKDKNINFDHTTLNDFWQNIKNYDILILDNIDFSEISKTKIITLLKKKPKKLEIIITTSQNKEFEELKDEFDLVTKYEYTKKFSDYDLTIVTGNGKGKSTWSFGYILKKLMYKQLDIDLIYLDKGGNYYGERFSFDKLKEEKFNYFVFGTNRFNTRKFRFENIDEDFKQIEKGFKKIVDSKADIVVCEEINTLINSKLTKTQNILNIIHKKIDNKIIFTGRNADKQTLDLAKKIVEVKEIKHYAQKKHSVRTGIDY